MVLHIPAEHTCWPLHTMPQPPQCCGLVMVFTHALPQRVPVAQPHLPALQTSPAAQLTPQAPQLPALLVRFTHALPHAVRPAPQLSVQSP